MTNSLKLDLDSICFVCLKMKFWQIVSATNDLRSVSIRSRSLIRIRDLITIGILGSISIKQKMPSQIKCADMMETTLYNQLAG